MIRATRRPPVSNYQELNLGALIPFAGLNLRDMDLSIGSGQTPYAKNMNLDDGGKPTKRRGQRYLFAASKGNSSVNGIFDDLYQNKIIYAHGTSIYSYDELLNQETTLISNLSDKKGYFYTFNDVLYYKNGVEFIKITPSLVASNAETSAYIPTLYSGCTPAGAGNAKEQRNLLQPGFKQVYDGTSGTTAYTLCFVNLDATLATAVVNGVTMNENAGFTVNRATGVITFNTAPGTGSSNVTITAYKTFAGDADKIKKAKRATLYGGGTNDSRVLVCGNNDYKNMYWYTGLTGNSSYDALYYPEFNFNRLGSDAKYISCWGNIYSKLLALKEDGIYTIIYNNTGTSTSFTATILNRQVGCDMPDSVQIIQDSPIFCNSLSGLHRIVPTFIEQEKNVVPISGLINKRPVSSISKITGLLEESNADLQDCSSFDDGHKYYLCIQDRVFVWDYEKSPYGAEGGQDSLIWFYYDNINANCWASINREIYYGHRDIGQLVKLQDALNDFGQPIEGVWRTKLFDFGDFTKYKNISMMWLQTRANQGSGIDIQIYNDNGDSIVTSAVPTNDTVSFDWDSIDWDSFNWDVSRFAPTIPIEVDIRDIIQLQAEFSNNKLNENLSILAFKIRYLVTKAVR